MIDRTALLADLRGEVTRLEVDIGARAEKDETVDGRLRAQHDEARTAGRTSLAFEDWRAGEVTQAAVGWVLSCVFVRFLEDNALVDVPLITGVGDRRRIADDERRAFFDAHPEQDDRHHLRSCFTLVASYPAVASLFDGRHAPVFALEPSPEGATALRERFRRQDPATGEVEHDFTDPARDTRFLGDLYQDLSEAAKKRYALLQTPEFVEELILDRTLDPAIDEFGLEHVRLIDPTCGSGHFLVGALRRLHARWVEREPSTSRAELVVRVLEQQVHGVDLNPYATAIARFRLVVEALTLAGIDRLAAAPPIELQLATGDSLLHGPAPGQLFGAEHLRSGIEHHFASEDGAAADRLLGQGYHAVVGNPPYIAVQDGSLRDAYRERYASCHGKYVLTVPFMERFFELAQPVAAVGGSTQAGFVGKITGNNFMKREFGAPLVERFLPSIDLQTVVDASGAYIPGHGTPTVLLFGRARAASSSRLRVLDGVRGEPSQPADPAHGLVWRSIVEHLDRPGAQDAFVRAQDIERRALLTHPMTLGVGRDLKRAIEARAARRLDAVATSVGIVSFTLEDDLFVVPERMARLRELGRSRPLVEGDGVRDWGASPASHAVFPYDERFVVVGPEPRSGWWRHLWRGRTLLAQNKMFGGKTKVNTGLRWYEFGRLTTGKLRTPLTITWGEVATHNHFVLDRGGKVFKQTAPVIKLPEAASEEDHLRLLGVLNSSVAAFWLKQVCQPKGGDHVGQEGARVSKNPWEDRFALNSSNVAELPLPAARSAALPRELDRLATERAEQFSRLEDDRDTSLGELLDALAGRDARIGNELVALQEELDWQVLAAFGLAPVELTVGTDAPPIALGERAFEIDLARQVERGEAQTTWFKRHGSTPRTELPPSWPDAYRDVVERRIALIEADPDVGLIERPEHKRRWVPQPWSDRRDRALRELVLDRLEAPEVWTERRLRTVDELLDVLRADHLALEALEILGGPDAEPRAILQGLVDGASVAHVAAARLKPAARRKRARWERTWELQRHEDRIDARSDLPPEHPEHLTPEAATARKAEEVGAIDVPPKYAPADFRDTTTWGLRGKLDVPKERFRRVVGGERGGRSVYGWAGWDELAESIAIATRVGELRDEEAAEAGRLLPLLAGVLERLAWVAQWHPDSDPDYQGPPADFLRGWLDTQLAELGLSDADLTAWEPPAPTRGRRARTPTS